MTDIASDLRERFDFAVLWFHEKCELDSSFDERTIVNLTDDEARAVKILETLSNSVDAIPSSAIKTAEELRDADPVSFEQTFSAWGASRRLRVVSNQRHRIY
jgi:hypothetical protein